MHVQLDLLGGLAGDMFIAAVLDAFPEHADGLHATCAALATRFGRAATGIRLLPHNDGIFRGARFEVDDGAAVASTAPHAHPHGERRVDPHPRADDHDHVRPPGEAHEHPRAHDAVAAARADHGHAAPGAHVRWSDIRARLEAALAPGVLRHAVGVFGALAEAESDVHGVPVDAVEFHEVGAWDSVVDIVGAAWLIDVLDARSWQVGAVPLGFGRIRSAHGPMPVPPPATALLLRGFSTLDDGIGGERVTPTGAAILKYLLPDGNAAPATRPPETRVLRRSGVGFGSRRLAGISNCVRLLVFDDAAATPEPAAHRELAVVEFEVDDQSAEELAMGLDRLRAHDAVFDVIQAPVFGKKGRMMTAVRLLARPADLDAVLAACFRETTTIGLRHTTVRGRALPRRSDEVEVDGHRVRVKTVERPGGPTAKAESDDALAHETHAARRRLRAEAERRVLDAAAAKGPRDA